MKIIAISGSLSSESINEELLEYIIKAYQFTEIKIIDNKSLQIPTYSADLENNLGVPSDVKAINEQMSEASAVIFATPEHNGSMTAHLKSLLDWLSRENRDFIRDKPVFILGTSPGRSGAAESIETVRKFATRLGGNVVATYSLPSFGHVFENNVLLKEHSDVLDLFVENLKSI